MIQLGFHLMKGEALLKISEQLQSDSEKAEKLSFSFNGTFYGPLIKYVCWKCLPWVYTIHYFLKEFFNYLNI